MSLGTARSPDRAPLPGPQSAYDRPPTTGSACLAPEIPTPQWRPCQVPFAGHSRCPGVSSPSPRPWLHCRCPLSDPGARPTSLAGRLVNETSWRCPCQPRGWSVPRGSSCARWSPENTGYAATAAVADRARTWPPGYLSYRTGLAGVEQCVFHLYRYLDDAYRSTPYARSGPGRPVTPSARAAAVRMPGTAARPARTPPFWPDCVAARPGRRLRDSSTRPGPGTRETTSRLVSLVGRSVNGASGRRPRQTPRAVRCTRNRRPAGRRGHGRCCGRCGSEHADVAAASWPRRGFMPLL